MFKIALNKTLWSCLYHHENPFVYSIPPCLPNHNNVQIVTNNIQSRNPSSHIRRLRHSGQR